MDINLAWTVVNQSNNWLVLAIDVFIDHAKDHSSWLEQERINDEKLKRDFDRPFCNSYGLTS